MIAASLAPEQAAVHARELAAEALTRSSWLGVWGDFAILALALAGASTREERLLVARKAAKCSRGTGIEKWLAKADLLVQYRLLAMIGFAAAHAEARTRVNFGKEPLFVVSARGDDWHEDRGYSELYADKLTERDIAEMSPEERDLAEMWREAIDHANRFLDHEQCVHNVEPLPETEAECHREVLAAE